MYGALGDSTGVGVGARDGRGYVARLYERLRAQRTEARLLNACRSGATSADAVRDQLPRTTAAGPTVVTVFIGINDLIRGVSPTLYGDNLAQIAQRLTGHGACLFCGLPDLSLAPAAMAYLRALGIEKSSFEARTRAYNERVLASARAHGHAFLDLFGLPLEDGAHFFSADGFHPSAQGYEELASRIWPALLALLPAS
ncbi:MAG: Lipolytic enzyme precursor [Myxococcaceae bacterium]|nr:Lipolytic enzyme precursor [Myxococcaceae bacterium]